MQRHLSHTLLLFVPAVVSASPGHAQERPDPEAPEVVDVTVRGARVRPPHSSREPTAASTVISGDALASPGATSADVIARAPGVEVTRHGASSDLATASIRGATSAQTPVFLAGILINDDVAGTADLSTVPLWMLDRVEIYRGHAPAFADELGMGGAVFFEPRLPRRTRLGVGQDVGSFGELSTWIAGTVRAEHASSLVALRRASATNDYTYVNDGGTRFDDTDDREVERENADFVSHDAWAIGRYSLAAGGDLTVVSSAFDREQGVTGLSVIPARRSRSRVRRFLGGVSARVPCAPANDGETDGPCKLTLSSSVVEARTQIHDPLGELTLQSTQVSNDASRFTQRASVLHRIDDVHEVGASVSQAVEHLRIESVGGGGLRAMRSTTRAALTGTVQVSPRLGVHVIGAGACHTTDGPESAGACGVLAPSGRVGARVHMLSWVDGFANAGRYVRPPTLGELYGTSPVTRGNPDLVEEAGTTVDVGVRATRRGEHPKDVAAWAEVFGFARWAGELIAFQRSSFGVVRPFNVGQARILGVEMAGGAVWLDHVEGEVSVTLTDPRDTTPSRSLSNDILPFRSRFVGSGRLGLFTEPEDNALGLDRASVGARLWHRSSRFADPAGLMVIDDQTTVDVEVSGRFVEGDVVVRGSLRNVFDQAQFDTVGYPLPGRGVHVGAELWF